MRVFAAFARHEKGYGLFMKKGYYSDIELFLNELENDIGEVKYRGVLVFGFLRMPLYMLMKGIAMSKNKNQFVFCLGLLLRFIGSIVKSMVVWTSWTKGNNNNTDLKISGSVCFVLDYNYSSYLSMQYDIIDKCDQESLLFITINKAVYTKIRQRFPHQSVVPSYNVPISLRWRHVKALIELIMGSNTIRRRGFLIKVAICSIFIRGVKEVDFYKRIFEEYKIRAIITLNDTHSHEYIITNVANEIGIRTYTLQHGATCIAYVPVSSDKMFVWGDVNKREVIGLKVPEDKVIVSGKPGLDGDLRKYLGKEKLIKKEFAKKHCVDPNKYIVSFFPTRYAYKENLERFKCFASICQLDISPIIKLRSNSTGEDIELYRNWLKDFQIKKNVPIVVDEDLSEIFVATDILITTESSVGIEALPFSVIVVLLDIFDHINLKDWVLQYEDSLIAKSKEDFLSLIERVITERNYFLSVKNNSYLCYKKYFHNSTNWDASSFIAWYVSNSGVGSFRLPHFPCYVSPEK